MKKKVLSLMLCLIMIFGVGVPGTFAENNFEETNLGANQITDVDSHQTSVDSAIYPAAAKTRNEDVSIYQDFNAVSINSKSTNNASAENKAVICTIPEKGTDVLILEQCSDLAYRIKWNEIEGYVLSSEVQINNTETEKERVILNKSVGDSEISVTGALPENAQIAVDKVSNEVIEKGKESLPIADTFEEGYTIAGYDIKIQNDGVDFQPDENIKIEIEGINQGENQTVIAYHLLDTAEAITDDSLYFTGKDLCEQFPAETAASGKEDTVYYEIIFPTVNNDGSISFDTDSLSTYLVVSGNTTVLDYPHDAFVIGGNYPPNADKNIYNYLVAPNSVITFYWKQQRVTEKINWKPGNNEIGLIEQYSHEYKVAIPEGEEIGTKLAISVGDEYTINLEVATNQQIAEKSLTGGNFSINGKNIYRAMITCLKDPHNGLPGEPSIHKREFAIVGTNSKDGTNNILTDLIIGGIYSKQPGNVIKREITKNSDFIASSDGSNTMGIVDPSGVKTKIMLKLIDDQWERILEKIAKSGEEVYASNGTKIDEGNYTQYMIIPYVVKFQTSAGYSWNIDCYIVHKENQCTLRYDLNFSAGFVCHIPTPDTVTGFDDFTVKVFKGSEEVPPMLNGKYEMQEGATGPTEWFEFMGWNTKKDGKGTWYNEDEDITVKKDNHVTLYGQWKRVRGQLTISKEGGAADEPYVFSILKDGEKYTECSITGNGSKTIYELPLGEYTIKEDTNWSWRYEANNGDRKKLTADTPTGSITCTNKKVENYWLNGYSPVVVNTYGVAPTEN